MRRRAPAGPVGLLALTTAGLLAFGVGAAAAQASASVQISHAGAPTDCNSSSPYGYEPAEVHVDRGGTVTWSNPSNHGVCGAQPHPSRCLNEAQSSASPRGRTKGTCPWSSFTLDAGESVDVSFPQDGTFQYQCSVHPYMYGTVVAGDGEPGDPAPSPPPPPPPPEPEPEPQAPSPTDRQQPGATQPPTTPAGTGTVEGTEATTPTVPSTEVTPAPVATAATASPTPSPGPGAASEEDDGSNGGLELLATILLAATTGALVYVRQLP
ncbi:MAG: hypothetical protein KY469_11755 [Actinobacteria bacterium]|nr:hypothetical protein [Actinomycetota bacterium]